MTYRSLFAIFIIVMAGPKLFAQEGGAPQNTLLPAIDPQDIEIRSEFKARFPGLRRQPILGFNPKPRVFRIDPNRMPFMESPDEAVASISTTQLDRPLPPNQSILRTPNRTTAYVRAGVGSFISPEIEAYALHKISDVNLISGNLNFRSSDGHLVNQSSGFRFFDTNVLYSTRIREKVRASFKGEIISDFNNIFELSPNVPNDGSGTAKKNYLGMNAGMILSGNKNALEGWKYFLNIAATEMDLSAPNNALKGELTEQVASTGFENVWAGAKLNETFSTKVNLNVGNYSPEGLGSTQWVNTNVSIAYNTLYNYATKVSISGGVGYVGDGINKKILFITNSNIDHSITDALSLRGGIYAAPDMKTAWSHHQTNRFLNANTQLQYEYTMGAEGGVEFVPLQGTKLFGLLRYEHISNNAYYEREERNFGVNIEPLYYNVNYGDATLFELRTGITQQLVMDKLWFDGVVYARRPKLKSAGDIPFEERLGGEAAFNFKPVDQIKIQSWAHFKGEREAPAGTQNLDGYVLVNASVDYEINSKFGVYFKVLNILGNNYKIWDGYEERPFQVFGGIKLKL